MKNALTKTCFYSALLASTVSMANTKTPNVVFILADQWRGNAIGYLNKEPVQTPNLDQLAQEGIHFTQAVSGYPVSSPARGMLMTGRYPTKSGVPANCNSQTAPYGVEMSKDSRCWSDVLADHNFDLAYIGKWHLDAPYKPYIDTYNNRGKIAWNEYCPTDSRHGFSHWIAYGTYDYHLKPMYWKNEAPRDDYYYVDEWGPTYETNEGIKYIENKNGKYRDASKPFALVLSYNPPHTGYDLVPDKYKVIYKDLDVEKAANKPNIPPKGTKHGDFFRKNLPDYYACMTGVDHEIGRVIQSLKEQGLYDNTILVFTSDHGDQMGINDCIGKNIYYEASMHIPLILSWPNKLKPRQDSLLISFEDLNPTLTSLVGLQTHIPKEVQTFDLSEQILNGTAKEGLIQPYFYVDFKDFKNGWRGLRTERYTYAVHAKEGDIIETVLYDRLKDPYQLENSNSKQKEVSNKLNKNLIEWLHQIDDPFITNF